MSLGKNWKHELQDRIYEHGGSLPEFLFHVNPDEDIRRHDILLYDLWSHFKSLGEKIERIIYHEEREK